MEAALSGKAEETAAQGIQITETAGPPFTLRYLMYKKHPTTASSQSTIYFRSTKQQLNLLTKVAFNKHRNGKKPPNSLVIAYLCNLNSLITVEIPHFGSFITGSSKDFTPILKKNPRITRPRD